MFGLHLVSLVVGAVVGQIPAVALWIKKQLTSAKAKVETVTVAAAETAAKDAASTVATDVKAAVAAEVKKL